MHMRIGTFNLKNLFSRFNFQGVVGEIPDGDAGGLTQTFANGQFEVRTFVGRLVRAKDLDDTVDVARRIREVMDADVLAISGG